MIEIFFFHILGTLLILGHGLGLSKVIKIESYLIDTQGKYIVEKLFFVGFVALSFISLSINFFFPINTLINNILFLTGLTFLFINFKKINNVFIYSVLITGVIGTLIVYYSNINRPDAGLYHLPYVAILNDFKIIGGLTNLHGRFGHISIVQYSSAALNNSIFNANGIVLPLSMLVSFYFLYLVKVIIGSYKSNLPELYKIFFIGLLIFSVSFLDRYSDYGNDAPGIIFIYLAIISLILFTKNYSNNYLYMSIFFITYSFLNKPMLLIGFLLPMMFLNKKKIFLFFKQRVFFFCLIFLLLWIVKNIIISGCLIYPKKETCIEKFSWVDQGYIESVKNAENEAEAWSKGWVDQNKTNNKNILSYQQYNKEFNWLKVWFNTHFQVILSKIFPFNIVMIVIMLFIYLSRERDAGINLTKNDKKNIIKFFIFSVVGILFWFLKFPLYRFGSLFIFLLIMSFYLLIFAKNKFKITYRFSLIIIFISFFSLVLINLIRISKSSEFNGEYWPNIYQKNLKTNYKKIKLKHLDIYQSSQMCMYEKAPCTHLNQGIVSIKKLGYIFLKKK